MSRFWIWVNSECSFNTRRRSQWIGKLEREKGKFSEVIQWGCACWRNNAAVDLDVDPVVAEDDVCIGLDLRLHEWVTGCEEEVDDFLDELLDSRFRMSSTEKVEYKLVDSLGYSNENVSKLISEVVFRSSRIEELDGSSILFCRAEVVCSSHNVTSIDFGCLKGFDFLATAPVGDGGGNGKRGWISNGSGIWVRLGVFAGVIAGATGIGDRGGLWAATVWVIEFSELHEVWTVALVSTNF